MSTLASAVLTVTYTPQTDGFHRICYREVNSGVWICTTDDGSGPLGQHPTCLAGQTCTFDINIQVDNESCDTQNYEGYVQPACESEESVANRFPVISSFIPNPSCRKWLIECPGKAIVSYSVTEPGSGYNPLSPPSVGVSGDGSNATAIAVVGTGSVFDFNASLPGGSSYNSPDGNYSGVTTTSTSGVGTGFLVDITIVGGQVTVANFNDGGDGYQIGDTFEINDPSGNNVGVTLATGTIIDSDYGTIIAINVGDFGNDYTFASIIIAAPVSGTQAEGTAEVGSCSSFQYVDCNGPVGGVTPGVAAGTTFAMCNPSEPVLEGYNVTENGACVCDCNQYTLSGSGASASYTDCDGNAQTISIPISGSPSSESFCAIVNTVLVLDGNLADNGPCPV